MGRKRTGRDGLGVLTPALDHWTPEHRAACMVMLSPASLVSRVGQHMPVDPDSAF